MGPNCLARSAARMSASISAYSASSSSENGDTTAGLGAVACPAVASAGLPATLRLPPPDPADLIPDASSTADIDISDRATMICRPETPRGLFCFFFINSGEDDPPLDHPDASRLRLF